MVRQIRNPQRWTVGETDGVRQHGLQQFAHEAEYIARRLNAAPWWYGETWSILDVYLAWLYTAAASEDRFPLFQYGALVDHGQRVRARPSFQRALQRERDMIKKFALPFDVAAI
jgi:glutathione S-transferase